MVEPKDQVNWVNTNGSRGTVEALKCTIHIIGGTMYVLCPDLRFFVVTLNKMASIRTESNPLAQGPCNLAC